MAPKGRRETPLERAERLQRTAIQLKVKSEADYVRDSLKQHPRIVHSLYNLTCQLIGPPTSKTATQPPSAFGRSSASAAAGVTGSGASEADVMLALEDGSSDSVRAGTVSPSPSPRGSAEMTTEPSPAGGGTQLRRLDQCSVSFLKELMASYEPVAFSAHALSALVKRGAREVNMNSLLQCHEFATGMTRNTVVRISPEAVITLKRQCADLAEMLGHRALQLRLPPNWTESGIYKLEASKQSVLVVNSAGVKRRIPPHLLDGALWH